MEPFGQALWCFLAGNLADRKRVISDNGAARHADVGLRRARLLIHPGIAQQVTIKFFSAAVESFNRVIGPQLFNAAVCDH